jgi:hypothetical protein
MLSDAAYHAWAVGGGYFQNSYLSEPIDTFKRAEHRNTGDTAATDLGLETTLDDVAVFLNNQ